MIESLRCMFRHVFTGADNKTYHMAKFSWAGSMMTICSVMLHRSWIGQEVDLMAAAGALVAVATGHSAAIYGMKTTEPPHDGPANEPA